MSNLGPTEITPADIERLRTVDDEQAAEVLTLRIMQLAYIEKRMYAERGLIALEVEDRKLWQFVRDADGKFYRSFNRWVIGAGGASRASIYDAMATVKELRHDVSRDDLLEISRVNVKQLARVSTAVRKDPEVIEAAKTQEEAQFVATVNQRHPGQLLEFATPLTLKTTPGLRFVMDETCQAVEALFGIKGLESVIELLAVGWLDSMCEIEQFAGLTNRQAAVALLASGQVH